MRKKALLYIRHTEKPDQHSKEEKKMADAAAMAKANEPVPDMVKQFVVYFYRHIREKNGACHALLSPIQRSGE